MTHHLDIFMSGRDLGLNRLIKHSNCCSLTFPLTKYVWMFFKLGSGRFLCCNQTGFKGIVHFEIKMWYLSAYPKGIQDVGVFFLQ